MVMSEFFSSLLEVSVDFETSHLIFPTIILSLLGFLSLWIVIANRKLLIAKAKGEQGGFAFFKPGADKFRLFATLALVAVYFYLMDVVGQQFPNTGYGFLFTSIPFIFLLSTVYAHQLDGKKLLIISLNAIIAPLCAWYVLGQLFSITLP
jgi:putative tricarboxylic transport membrane protein